jgi:hypothetical protein
MQRPRQSMPRVTWSAVVEESDDLHEVACLARGHSRAALTWLRAALPLLSRLADAAATAPAPYALLHNDTRSGDMLPTAKAGGFSGYARPNGPRYRLTGLPGPKSIDRRVLIAVQHQATMRADMGTH